MWVRERAELWPFWDYVWEAAPLPVLCRITVLMDVSDVGAGKGGIMADLGPSLGREAPIPAFSKGSSARKVARNSAKFFPKLMENSYFFTQNGAKMGSGPHLGRRWVRGGKKGAQGHRCQPISEVIFETLGHLFRFLFLMLFWKASFSPLGRLLGAQGAQKGAKMEPKWIPKRAWGTLWEV